MEKSLRYALAGAALATLVTSPAIAELHDSDIILTQGSDSYADTGINCSIVEPAQIEPIESELSKFLRQDDPDMEPITHIPYKRTPSDESVSFSALQLGPVFAASIHSGPLSGHRLEYNYESGEVRLDGDVVELNDTEGWTPDDATSQEAVVGDLKVTLGNWEDGDYYLSIESTENRSDSFSTHLSVTNGAGYHQAYITEYIETVATVDGTDLHKTLQCSTGVDYPEGTSFHDMLPAMRDYERTLE